MHRPFLRPLISSLALMTSISAVADDRPLSLVDPRRPTFRTLADLANERWALPQTSSSLYQVLGHQFAELGLPPPRVSVEWTGSGVPIAELLRNT